MSIRVRYVFFVCLLNLFSQVYRQGLYRENYILDYVNPIFSLRSTIKVYTETVTCGFCRAPISVMDGYLQNGQMAVHRRSWTPLDMATSH